MVWKYLKSFLKVLYLTSLSDFSRIL